MWASKLDLRCAVVLTLLLALAACGRSGPPAQGEEASARADLSPPAATPSAEPGRLTASAPRPTQPGVLALRGDGPGLAFSVAPGLLATASGRVGAVGGTISLEGADGATLQARVLARNEPLGLALLVVLEGPVPEPLPFASPSGLKAGDSVQGVGSPAAVFQRLRIDGRAVLLETDATPTSSAVGGPLLDRRRQVVGIAVVRPGREQAEFVAIDHVSDLIRSHGPQAARER